LYQMLNGLALMSGSALGPRHRLLIVQKA
jgi:hypothetical protein